MGQFVVENAHNRIDPKAYGEGWDRVFGKKPRLMRIEEEHPELFEAAYQEHLKEENEAEEKKK